MKNIRNSKIPKAMTTQVIMGILDECIECIVRPLLENCNMYRRILLQVLFEYSSDSRRRFGVRGFYECTGDILLAIENKDYYALKQSQIDRNLLVCIAKYCLDQLEPSVKMDYKVATKKRGWPLKRLRLSIQVGCNIDTMAPLYRWCKSYCALYDRYLEEIYQKYEKLLVGRSNSISHNSKMYVDSNHLLSNLKMAVGRAIDRCDVEKGTLTSMVLKCLMTYVSNPEFEHLYNISFTVPANVRRRKAKAGEVIENFSVDLTKAENMYVEPVDKTGVNPTLLSGLKKLRNTSICHLVMGLPIILTEQEKDKLRGITQFG